MKKPYDIRSRANDLPLAGDTVDDLTVRKNVPNIGSIRATFSDYTILTNIRRVTFTHFEDHSKPTNPDARLIKLATDIATSGEINPLIVVWDAQGPYILEGSHRYDALLLLDKTALPALVVIDED